MDVIGEQGRHLPARCSTVRLSSSPRIVLGMSTRSRIGGWFGKKNKSGRAGSASPQPSPPSTTLAASPTPVRMPQTCAEHAAPNLVGLDRCRRITSVALRPWPLHRPFSTWWTRASMDARSRVRRLSLAPCPTSLKPYRYVQSHSRSVGSADVPHFADTARE
jgi:hypothetical protein